MAYSNWGAFVYCNGQRRLDKEDVGVFDTDEASVPSGVRIFANLFKTKGTPRENDWSVMSHHAVLGDGPVRLCGYKCTPELWIWKDGKAESVKLPKPDSEKGEYELYDQSGIVELDGQTWSWWFDQFGENKIDLKLIEPDGTVWTSRCGFEYGVGWMD